MNLIVVPDLHQILVTIAEPRLDAAVATSFKDRMREIVSTSRKTVLLDLQRVDFMDSSGLGAMIAIHKAMPDGIPLVLRGLTPNVERVFRLTRMDSVFNISAAPDQAREAG
ncbi:STAS domain-containing protein [Paracoccus zhejiangensis]|uniref:Anti-sigma factor antagonist n=1 Tax=Paracoccus zhejiangensis TaxID=1077935 RepID=A0A2H5F1B5_9RHOB|nr:STAS domain-containing protein [Paracoccus zhejiangensis]AUH65322.1 anti-sigma factor antagonist [Paracoccus zhejiangensis]